MCFAVRLNHGLGADPEGWLRGDSGADLSDAASGRVPIPIISGEALLAALANPNGDSPAERGARLWIARAIADLAGDGQLLRGVLRGEEDGLRDRVFPLGPVRRCDGSRELELWGRVDALGSIWFSYSYSPR